MRSFHSPRALRAALALATLGASLAAHAATKTYTYDLGLLTAAGSVTSWDKSLGLPKFDGTLGTLTSVALSLDASISTDQSYTNKSAASATYTGKSGAMFYLENASDVDLIAQPLTVTNAPTVGAGVTVKIANQLASGSYAYSATSGLSSYVGTGDLGFHLIAADSHGTTGTGQYDASYTTRATGKGSIVYTYNPVPEPTSVAALALGALGLVRRRRGAK